MQCAGIGATTQIIARDAEVARGSLAPPPAHDPVLSEEMVVDVEEEEVVGEGSAWTQFAHTVKNEETKKGTKEFALNRALSTSGWSMDRVMDMLPGEAIDQLVEHMPLASYYVGGDPETVERTRHRLQTTEGFDFKSELPARHWRTVTSIPPIDIDNSAIRDSWQQNANETAALSSGYGRSAAHAIGTVPDASTWIEAVGQLEPVLNREDGTIHAYEMHARITAFLVQYARARHLSVHHVSSAVIDPVIVAGGGTEW